MIEDLFEEREELLKAFAAVQRRENDLEEAQFGAEALPLLQKVEKSVQSLGLFSPNEPFDEVDTQLQPLILLPYFLALAEGSARSNRLQALDAVERHLHAFLGLAQHYGLASALLRQTYAQSQRQKGFQLAREDKIALYREEKALEEEGAKLAAAGSASALNANMIASRASKALTRLLLLPQERQILEFGARLDQDPQARAEYERQRAQPAPKPSFFRVEKPPTALDAPCEHAAPAPAAQVVESFEQKMANERARKIEQIRANTPHNARLEILAKLNQPSHAQPTMTLDEFDELEYTLLKQKEAEAARFKREKEEALRRMGIEDSEDSENEAVADMKTYKARAWDDFKDENEKGGGNRMGK